MIVPAIPPVDQALVDEHAAAHALVDHRLSTVAPDVRQIFVFQQRRLVREGIAYVQPVTPFTEAQLLFPPPRAFLSSSQQRRLQGADVVFRHLDSRAAMRAAGYIPSVLDRTTPCVLHALLEGTNPSGRETNPGMLRVTPTGWHPEVNAFVQPPLEVVPELVEAALGMAADAPTPSAVRAAWLTFTMLCVHPFVDGNGRVSRSLYMAVVADELPTGIDWGVLEQWSRNRTGYIAALHAGQRVERYEPAAMDAAPFIEFATRSSIEGAHLCLRRLDALEQLVDADALRDLSSEERVVTISVELMRNASVTELAGLGLADPVLRTTVAELLDRGRLRWVRRPASRISEVDRSPYALVPAPRA